MKKEHLISIGIGLIFVVIGGMLYGIAMDAQARRFEITDDIRDALMIDYDEVVDGGIQADIFSYYERLNTTTLYIFAKSGFKYFEGGFLIEIVDYPYRLTIMRYKANHVIVISPEDDFSLGLERTFDLSKWQEGDKCWK